MEIRKFSTPADNMAYKAICTTVFLDMQREDMRAQLKNPPADEQNLAFNEGNDSSRWGAFDENGKMHSALIVVPFTMMMNGKEVKMGGIGGVVTRPESRGLGLIRQIMDKIFEEMQEMGQTFSFLYPFSYGYYRNFGYETCYSRDIVRIPIEQFAGYKYPKNMVPYEPGDDYQPYADIYAHFAKSRNLAIVRNETSWKKMLDRDPYKNLDFTYLSHDPQGNPNAYVLYKGEKRHDGNLLKVREIAWKTTEGLQSIFGFFSKLGAEYETVEWSAPGEVNTHVLFPEGYDLSWSRNAVGMNRIVNVLEGLKTLNAPSPQGSVVVAVTDKYLPANDGSYQIAWENGALNVTKTEAAPDLTTTVETLVQLVTGYATPSEVAFQPHTTIHSQCEVLEALFPKQKLHLLEGF